MDLLYHFTMHGTNWPITDRADQWKKAKELFINPIATGYQDGGSCYGLLLNRVETGVWRLVVQNNTHQI